MLSTKERLCQERQKRRLRLLKITLCFLCFIAIVVGTYALVHQPWFAFGKVVVERLVIISTRTAAETSDRTE